MKKIIKPSINMNSREILMEFKTVRKGFVQVNAKMLFNHLIIQTKLNSKYPYDKPNATLNNKQLVIKYLEMHLNLDSIHSYIF